MDPSVGSLKDSNLFRRFFVCMNYETRDIPVKENSNSSNSRFEFETSSNTSKIEANSFYSNLIGNFTKRVVGLYIQYGTIEGYNSDQIVHLSYFDPEPLEPRYYMFGRYLNSFSKSKD